jgi:hypothetical protein
VFHVRVLARATRMIIELTAPLVQKSTQHTVCMPNLTKRKMKAWVKKNTAIVRDAVRQFCDMRSRGSQVRRGSTIELH